MVVVLRPQRYCVVRSQVAVSQDNSLSVIIRHAYTRSDVVGLC